MFHFLMLWLILPFALTTLVLVALALRQAVIGDPSVVSRKRE